MKISLISHASVILETKSTKIWTDPWLFGKAFNESWALFPEVNFNPKELESVDYLWVSHEHPDHFHLPTLKSLPTEFKERVTVLFKKDNSDKLPSAFRKIGFKKIRLLPHREVIALDPYTSIYCYQVAFVDSCLGVREADGPWVFNINDAPFSKPDAKIVLEDLGVIDTVLNQFSMATYNGNVNYSAELPREAKKILQIILENHKDLKARSTIPFASFVYFCTEDNGYMNAYKNTPRDVFDYFQKRDSNADILYPGDCLTVEKRWDSQSSLAKFDEAYRKLDAVQLDPSVVIPTDEILGAFRTLMKDLAEKYGALTRLSLGRLTAYVPDLNECLYFSVRDGRAGLFKGKKEECDLIVNSQPLYYCFKYSWGGQTLTVSARVFVQKRFTTWLLYRIVFALNNAEIYLRLKYLLRPRMIVFFGKRFRGLVRQTLFQISLVRN